MLDLEYIVFGYLNAAEALAMDDGKELSSHCVYSFDASAWDKARDIVHRFVLGCRICSIDLIDIGIHERRIGGDIFLSQNGHGAGFWDEDLGHVGDELHRIAAGLGKIDCIADNLTLYLE